MMWATVRCSCGGRPGHCPRQSRAQEQRTVAHIIVVQVLRQRSVSIGVIDSVLDEGLLPRLLSDGAGCAGLERPSTNCVHSDTPLPARLVGKSAGVGLELSLGGRHATTVSRNYLLGGNVGE